MCFIFLLENESERRENEKTREELISKLIKEKEESINDLKSKLAEINENNKSISVLQSQINQIKQEKQSITQVCFKTSSESLNNVFFFQQN